MGVFHDRGCGHHHFIEDKNRLLIAILINFFIAPLEIWGGINSGSFSLLSDGIHMISHFGILTFAYFAEVNSRYVFYAVLTNALFLIGLSIYMLIIAIWKFIFPSDILYGTMFIIAFVGLIADMAQIILLYPAKSHHGSNMKSVFGHALSDAGLSFAVVMGSGCIYLWGFYRIDAVVLFMFFPLVLFWGINLIKESKCLSDKNKG